ncbi:hypothetical protein OK348_07585 [Flavobacterium sp. MXW15]|uniref:Uncharacterized protein n=1 Tax=Xanthomonas chitinilytica TaxID=2989819 RepID=A0ABT3JTS6_9XANT|nr:XVIPCD domain-containing protein [Xanthomonas sp. H13-6]MCW4454657.1 hypothetical protein [Flavobacterium sp. MXW15]MCW4471896.1 hypothetical protein [Xanthomonas sp. H13-6]
MASLDFRIEPLLAGLADDPRMPKGAEEDIRRVISESPLLSKVIANAAKDGQIGRIAISNDHNSAGHFEDGKNGRSGTIYISEKLFDESRETRRLDRLTEVLGHEAMHGALTDVRTRAQAKLRLDVNNAMVTAYEAGESVADLTGPVRAYLQTSRRDEASAELFALRALNDRIAHGQSGASATDLESELLQRSMSRCVDRDSPTPRFAEGITYEALTRRPYSEGAGALTDAVEQCFYDGKATLGREKDSDYLNYYGTHAINVVARDYAAFPPGQVPPRPRIDLESLGLDAGQLQRNGVDLGKLSSLTVLDKSSGRFDYMDFTSADRHEVSPRLASPSAPSLTPDDPRHPDHAMLEQIRGKVAELDKANGRTFDQASECLSASLLAAAKEGKLERVDHVLLSRAVESESLPAAYRVFAVEGDPMNPAHHRASVLTEEAVARPVQESFGQVEAINQRHSQEQAMEQQRTQEQQQHQKSAQHSL